MPTTTKRTFYDCSKSLRKPQFSKGTPGRRAAHASKGKCNWGHGCGTTPKFGIDAGGSQANNQTRSQIIEARAIVRDRA